MRKILSILGVSIGLAWTANAVQFTLYDTTATIVGGNIVPSFYNVTPPATTGVGTAGSLYTATYGGSSTTGFFVDISFNGNPQPFLTDAILKAADSYLEWDSTDLAAFNSGTYSGIILYNGNSGGSLPDPNGIVNSPGNAYQGTSHAGLDGRLGVAPVPDGGLTITMLGMAMGGLAWMRRKI
jgi:hypothetical protein